MNSYFDHFKIDINSTSQFIDKLKSTVYVNSPDFTKIILELKNNIELTSSVTDIVLLGVSNNKLINLFEVIKFKLKDENFDIVSWDYIITQLLNFLINEKKIKINEYFYYIEIIFKFLEEYFFIIKKIDKEKDIFLEIDKKIINISLLVSLSNLIIKIIYKFLEIDNIFSIIYEFLFYEKLFNKRFDELIRSKITDFDKIISEEDINNIISDDEYNKIIFEEKIKILKKDLNLYYNFIFYQNKLKKFFETLYDTLNKENNNILLTKLLIEYFVKSEYEFFELFFNDLNKIIVKFHEISKIITKSNTIDMKTFYNNSKKIFLEILLLIDYKEDSNESLIFTIQLDKIYKINLNMLYVLIEKIYNYINDKLEYFNDIQITLNDKEIEKNIENILNENTKFKKYKNLLKYYIYYFGYFISKNKILHIVKYYELFVIIIKNIEELKKEEKLIILKNFFNILVYLKKMITKFDKGILIIQPIIQSSVKSTLPSTVASRVPKVSSTIESSITSKKLPKHRVLIMGGKKTKSKKNRKKPKTRKIVH